MNSRCFKIHCSYSTSFNVSNVGKFFWIWILKGCMWVEKRIRKAVDLCSRPLKKKICQFHFVAAQQRQRNVQKSVLHVQSCCFVNLNIAFMTFSLPSSTSLLKIPKMTKMTNLKCCGEPKTLTCLWKCEMASPLYDISSFEAPFLISGRSDMESRTVMVR